MGLVFVVCYFGWGGVGVLIGLCWCRCLLWFGLYC